ncbi:MAG TPA: NHL repeat-containing protein [Chloroflexia bacterium]|nr:NHL repeat-containing protein [Chloroflexia bacterium]
MKESGRFEYFSYLLVSIMLAVLLLGLPETANAAQNCRYFSETGYTVSGKFLDYWNSHGGLPTFGLPLSEAQPEVDPETGKTFLTQWFERNRFELHTEYAGTRYEVLLGLLGKDLRREALAVDPDFKPVTTTAHSYLPADQQVYFPETGYNLDGRFLAYWRENGGLERFGFPISQMLWEFDRETSRLYQSQWFERARFELHPENQPPYDVLLGLLSKEIRNSQPGNLSFKWHVGTGSINILRQAEGLAVDRQGNLFAATSYPPRVIKYSPGGQFAGTFGSATQTLSASDLGLINPRSVVSDSQGNIYVADTAFGYIYKFNNAGRFLLRWGGPGDDKGQFGEEKYTSIEIAIDSHDNLYVNDSYHGLIQKFDSQGKYLSEFTNYLAGQLAIDRQGNLYVADWRSGDVYVYSPDGHLLTNWAATGGQPYTPVYNRGIAVDSKGQVYLPDTQSKGIIKFDSQGKYLGAVKRPENALALFPNVDTTCLTVDTQDNLFIAVRAENDQQIEQYDSQGNFIRAFGSSRLPGQFFNRAGMSSNLFNDGQDNIYTLDGSGRIQVVTSQGLFKRSWNLYDTSQLTPIYPEMTPLAVDSSSGAVYIADWITGYVKKFNKEGGYLLQWAFRYSETDRFTAAGLTVDSQGAVYLSDFYSSRVRKYSGEGLLLKEWNLRGDEAGSSGYDSAYSIVTDSNNNMYVNFNLRNIRKYDQEGKLLASWPVSIPPSGAPMAYLAVDKEANIYMANNNVLTKFDSQGKQLQRWELPVLSTSRAYAAGIAVDSQGNIYFSARGDDNTAFLFKFSQH